MVNNMANDSIGEILNLNPIEKEEKAVAVVYEPMTENQQQIETDANYVRQNLYDLIEKGHSAIDEMMAIADQSQHPRSYEVLAAMIKTMVETNKDLLDVHEKKKKLTKDDIDKVARDTINNNLFVGSTSDLLKILNKDDEPNT